ncbi:MAG: DUF2306 domain-containing protein [Pirellulales bacterium]
MKTVESCEQPDREAKRADAPNPWNAQRAALWLTRLLILQMIVGTLVNYRNYFPPNFQSDFLLGRKPDFAGPYQWAFYAHIVSGPLTLALGLILSSNAARRRSPRLHRKLGTFQVLCVLLILVPSGLYMAPYAATGNIAASGFAALALTTGWCTLQGWRLAVQHRIEAHRRWMLRSYVLLCSALVLRLIAGLAEFAGATWTYPLAAWVSWLLPLGILELILALTARRRPAPQSSSSLDHV